ncbi:MAG: cupin domain-containing protein [Gammaproteobacteria bacterium]|nr:cupin domain-containing protein [Gammaproteobacteria bacterium]
MKTAWMIPLAFTLLVSACERPQVGEMTFPEGTFQHAVRSDDIVWQPCPPTLPAGCQMALLEGNPQAAELFTVRFRLGGDFAMPPHTHPKEERVTVLNGEVSVAFGSSAERKNAKTFGPGDYYVNARNAIHAVWAKESSEIQITGIGPWEAHFVAKRRGE